MFLLFEPIGKISFCHVKKDIYTGESRGFGFVSFYRKDHAEEAQKKMNGHVHFRQPMRVIFKKNVQELNPNANLIVRNIDRKVTLA